MPDPSEAPVVAILVPLFGHSVLVADALLAAISQRSRYPFAVIVINDGCRFVESDLTIKSILAAHPERIRYVAQPNAGLSAARNTGIDYALAAFAALQAIYFLDADNFIQPNTIASTYSRLLQHPNASWVYPNIDMFGIRRNFDYGGPYSRLKHTRYNICEAGSLVHRRVFDAGVRFDESMRRGYEDWDFWLSAVGRGFTGVHDPHFGFLYRNRAESMLSQSKREDAEISAYLQDKHRSLLGKRNMARLEAAEAPRYALLFTDTNETFLSTGTPDPAGALPQAEFDRLFWRNMVIANWQHIPPVFIFTTRAVFEELTQSGLIPWLLYDCERTLASMNVACVAIERKTGRRYEIRDGGRTRDSSVLAIGRDLLYSVIKDADTRWIEQVQAPEPEMKVAARVLSLPQAPKFAATAEGTVIFAFLLQVMSWRASPYRPATQRNWMWRDVSVSPPHALVHVVREAFGGEVVYPAVPPTGRHIGFAISIGSFGGVERVAYNVARQFATAGWQVHLFLLGGSALELPKEFADVMTSLNFIEDRALNDWDSQHQYQGTALPAAGSGSGRLVNRIVAALGWLDVVVNCHCGALNAAAAPLRRLGVKTLTHLHLLDQSPLGRSVGHTMIALAYEHAYDLIVCDSERLTSWMHAAGIPYEKLLHVPNAPGHTLDSETRTKLLARRRQPANKHLNVIYLGRLDRQKGIDRLAGLVERAQALELPIKWRLVGGAVTGDCDIPPALARYIEPAVFETEALISLFHWADVMVLLSDYEGVPLSVLEARRAGVVVIATNVGELSEVIDSGRTGFLVEAESAVAETIDILSLLSNAPGLRPAIAAAAAPVAEWPQVTAELIQKVTLLVDGTRKSETSAQALMRYDDTPYKH